MIFFFKFTDDYNITDDTAMVLFLWQHEPAPAPLKPKEKQNEVRLQKESRTNFKHICTNALKVEILSKFSHLHFSIIFNFT